MLFGPWLDSKSGPTFRNLGLDEPNTNATQFAANPDFYLGEASLTRFYQANDFQVYECSLSVRVRSEHF